jgi:hypothetical protein
MEALYSQANQGAKAQGLAAFCDGALRLVPKSDLTGFKRCLQLIITPYSIEFLQNKTL